MRKFKALIYKDTLLLLRDWPGLAMMFLMPLFLVVLMAYLQDSTFNSINERKIPLLVLNQDRDSLGDAIVRGVCEAGIFKVDSLDEGQPLTAEALERAVAKGDYQIGIVIPANTTERIRSRIRQSVMQAFGGEADSLASSDSISIFVDPTTKNSFKSTILSSIREYAASLQTGFILREVVVEVNTIVPMPIGDISIPNDMVLLNERYARLDKARIIPNSVQHNVPAWGMFAVLLIVVSLGGNIINEREEGRFTRLLTMPCPSWLYLAAKGSVYLMVCILQLTLMFLIGIYVLPSMGLPALELGRSIPALVLMSLSASLAAICYGIAIGKIATSNQQASIFGAISVVIMAAVGGIWIPVFVMPEVMQLVSKISPLNWGLSGFYDIFVRDGDWTSVLPECGVLLLFSFLCLAVALYYSRRKSIR